MQTSIQRPPRKIELCLYSDPLTTKDLKLLETHLNKIGFKMVIDGRISFVKTVGDTHGK